MDSDIEVEGFTVYLHADRFRSPLKFGSVVMDSLTSMIVRADVRNRLGLRTSGWGAMPLAAKWAYPDPDVEEQQKIELMVDVGKLACKLIEDRWGK